MFSGQGVGAARRPSAALLSEQSHQSVGCGGRWWKTREQQLWRRPGPGSARLQTGRTHGVPQGSVLNPRLFQSEDTAALLNDTNSGFWSGSQGDVVSVTFVAGNPRHSGDIVRPEPAPQPLCIHLSALRPLWSRQSSLCCREIKLLSRWRFMTTEQTPGRSSTLMHHGRPGRTVCSLGLYMKCFRTLTSGKVLIPQCNKIHIKVFWNVFLKHANEAF